MDFCRQIHFLLPVCCCGQWFLEKIGLNGLNYLLYAYEDKSAYAQCIFAFTEGPEHEPRVFIGRLTGRIVPARGPLNFG